MTNVKPEPEGSPESLDPILTLSVRAAQANDLWSECGWLRYGYERPGPYQVTVRRTSTRGEMSICYTTSDEPAPGYLGGPESCLNLLILKSRADFADFSTPEGDLFWLEIWRVS